MIYYCCLITFGLILLTSCEKECRIVKETYENGKEKVVEYYSNCNDSTTFERQTFYENGQVSSESYVVEGVWKGNFKSWAENGNLTAAWEVLDGKENGFIQCWYDNGVKKREVILDKGVENGYFKQWNEKGRLEPEGNYLTGKKTGAWYYYDDAGGWNVRNYENGTLQGETFEYIVDSTSIKLVVGQYENGKEVGLWKWFDKDSVLFQTAMMSDGKYTGEYIKYYENGNVKLKSNLVDSKYEGEVFYFDASGEITKTVIYANGKLQPTRKK